MANVIEVEIRGRLNDTQYDTLKYFLDKNGIHQESHEREMFLLTDYPGYAGGFVGREVDIRLRNTNGNCEIMLKRKVGTAREEVSLGLKGTDLETAKKVVKALGCTNAIWMHRLKEVYEYKGIEWSLVIAPNNIRYFEVEMVIDDESKIKEVEAKLKEEVEALGLVVLDDTGTRDLVHQLDVEANKTVEL